MSFWRVRLDPTGELRCEQRGYLRSSREWIGSKWTYTPVVGCCERVDAFMETQQRRRLGGRDGVDTRRFVHIPVECPSSVRGGRGNKRRRQSRGMYM